MVCNRCINFALTFINRGHVYQTESLNLQQNDLNNQNAYLSLSLSLTAFMAATERSRSSSVLCPLCCLKTFYPRNSPKPSVAVPNHQKRKCMCSPTTHPGSFRCAFHRCLENEKNRTLNSQTQLSKCVNTTSNSGLNLRKMVLVNWLARITSVEAERLRKSLAASMVKPPPLHIGRRFDFRPQPNRFYALRKDQDFISRFCRLWLISCVRRNYFWLTKFLTSYASHHCLNSCFNIRNFILGVM